MNKQNKNIIKIILYAVLCLFFGEGVLGLGVYWPVLILIGEWKSVYWVTFVFGLFISQFYGMKVGMPSFVMVFFVAMATIFIGINKDSAKWMILFSVLANFIFDKIFGLHWSVWESVVVFLVGLWSFRGYKYQEIIKINF